MGNAALTVQARALQRAADILGGKDKLRAALHVPMARLEEWLDGRSAPPMEIFLKAVDIISTPTRTAAPTAAAVRARVLTQKAGELIRSANERIERVRALREQAQYAPLPKVAQFLRAAFAAQERASMLESALEAAMEAGHAQMGNVQVKASDGLRIAAHRGCSPAFLEFFSCVTDASCACGSALKSAARVVVNDVASDPLFAGTEAGRVLIDAGVLAVQCTPLVSSYGKVLGMVSTHYREPGAASSADFEAIDIVAQRTAYWLEQATA